MQTTFRYPGTLAYVTGTFFNDPEVDVVYGHRIVIDGDGMETGRCVLPGHDPETIKWMEYVPQETMFWRRRVWDRIGPLDESFRFALDWDFILRAHQAGFRFQRLPRFLGCFRVHERQKTTAMRRVAEVEPVGFGLWRSRALDIADFMPNPATD
ncbi:MAG TPA: hypothetical protein VLJ17_10060 [Xanthobacteraceae bacterium]|nr:hypothetical protein [Xanthobacteraceae bacterium]